MFTEIIPFETVSVDQRDVSSRAELAIFGAIAAMTFILFVTILA
jgi:hypothetical protein